MQHSTSRISFAIPYFNIIWNELLPGVPSCNQSNFRCCFLRILSEQWVVTYWKRGRTKTKGWIQLFWTLNRVIKQWQPSASKNKCKLDVKSELKHVLNFLDWYSIFCVFMVPCFTVTKLKVTLSVTTVAELEFSERSFCKKIISTSLVLHFYFRWGLWCMTRVMEIVAIS